jgi:hypothetical protein
MSFSELAHRALMIAAIIAVFSVLLATALALSPRCPGAQAITLGSVHALAGCVKN